MVTRWRLRNVGTPLFQETLIAIANALSTCEQSGGIDRMLGTKKTRVVGAPEGFLPIRFVLGKGREKL